MLERFVRGAVIVAVASHGGCGGREAAAAEVDVVPAVMTYELSVSDDAPSFHQLALQADVLIDGEVVGRLAQRGDELVLAFEHATLLEGRDGAMHPALALPTPCGSLTFALTPELPSPAWVIARHHAEQRPMEMHAGLAFIAANVTLRHAYVDRGTSTDTVQLGALTLPMENGEIAFPIDATCEHATVSVAGEPIAQWDAARPLFVNLVEGVCHHFVSRRYSFAGLVTAGEVDRMIAAPVEPIDTGYDYYVPIGYFSRPFPETVASTGGDVMLLGIERVACGAGIRERPTRGR